MIKPVMHCVAAAIALHFGMTAVADDKVADARYEAAVEHADADFKIANAKCDALEGNAEDVCKAEAKAAREAAEARAKAWHEGTPEAVAEARVDTADAELKAAKEKCDALSGNDKDVCVKKAELTHTQAVSAAEADEARVDATLDQQGEVLDAEYKLAMEKCESLGGDAEDSCEHGAKARYGK